MKVHVSDKVAYLFYERGSDETRLETNIPADDCARVEEILAQNKIKFTMMPRYGNGSLIAKRFVVAKDQFRPSPKQNPKVPTDVRSRKFTKKSAVAETPAPEPAFIPHADKEAAVVSASRSLR